MFTRYLFLIITLSALTALSGCSTRNIEGAGIDSSPESAEGMVFLADTAPVELLSPEFIERPMDELQRVISQFGDREYAMNAYLMADVSGIRMIGMGDMGQELFELEFSSDLISLTGMAVLSGVSPEYIVMDLQLAYYQFSALEERLRASGLSFEQTEAGSVRKRYIRYQGTDIIEITMNENELKLINHLREYEYSITRVTADE